MPDRQSWFLAAVAALLVAQVLLPADSVLPAQGAALPQVMLWLVLLIVYLVTTMLGQGGSLRWGIPDLLLASLILLHTIAALVAVDTAAPRPALNVLWTWVGCGCGYFLTRQLARSPQACRGLAALMIGIACGLAVVGYHQVIVELPAAREEYERDPEQVLRDALKIPP
nr:hypothetical protein [Planctomycetales bacterium]